MSQHRQKIAILGGGTGALSAAFGLTESPGWQQRYEITVYQMGWRLGGKGASGRNAAACQRIEEHGLHVWAGFYENGFRVMRQCYQELGRDPAAPLATWRDAFKGHSHITFEEQVQGHWKSWHVTVPTNDSLPGDGHLLPTLWDYIGMVLQWMIDVFERSTCAAKQALDAEATAPVEIRPDLHRLLMRVESRLEEAQDRIVSGRRESEAYASNAAPRSATLASPGTPKVWLLHSALKLVRTLSPVDAVFRPSLHHEGIVWLVDQFMARLRSAIYALVAGNDEARRLWMLLDLGAVHIRGMIKDQVIANGFDSIDGQEWSAWMTRHGATPETLASPMVRGTYNYIFGFRHGDIRRPAVGAGTCIRGLLRLGFTYKGAIFWEMQAGMGDTVFAPLYLVLQKRGVQFQFFHRVKELKLTADKKSIGEIHLGRQVTLIGDEYQPLVDVKDLPCWPSTPRYDQIREGPELMAGKIDLESYWSGWKDREEKVLRAGKEFDLVVLGISLGALGEIGPELARASSRWREMVEKVATVQTRALQLWLKPNALDLGWNGPPTILTAYEETLDTFADMSHLIGREDWPAHDAAASIAYYCGPLQDAESIPPKTDTGFPERERQRVKADAIGWLGTNSGHLWPKGGTQQNPAGLNWELLMDPSGGSGLGRVEWQYCRANVNPSDRYVLSVEGSSRYRLRAGESGFRNLFLAGDWVRSGINAGCVEAAVMAGLQASRAICGSPERIIGEADILPELLDQKPSLFAPLATIPDMVRRVLRAFAEGFRSAWYALPFASHLRPRQPLYITRGGEQVFPQPLELHKVHFYSFMFDAQREALQTLCDKYLNFPAGGHVEYRPLLARVLLGFAAIERAKCADPPEKDYGGMTEVDVAFWVPVVKLRRVGPLRFVESIAWFLPYVFVDNEFAIASGREIYGFPKELGEFRTPQGLEDPGPFTVKTFVLKTYSPATQASYELLLEVNRIAGSAAAGPIPVWHNHRDAFREFMLDFLGGEDTLPLPGLGLLVKVFDFLVHYRVPMFFLKEFRDVADSRRACYQAIVEAPTKLVKLYSASRMPGRYRVQISDFASHPILEELGLSRGEQTATGAWYVKFDSLTEAGREVWKAPLP